MVRIKKPTKAEMAQDWNSKEPRELAHEIAHFMGGKWPERRERKVPLSLEGAPLLAEELFEVTQLNPTLLNEMSVKTRLTTTGRCKAMSLKSSQRSKINCCEPWRKWKTSGGALSVMWKTLTSLPWKSCWANCCPSSIAWRKPKS